MVHGMQRVGEKKSRGVEDNNEKKERRPREDKRKR